MTFLTFQNFTDVRFSILMDIGFGENEISADVRFPDFFFGSFVEEGGQKIISHALDKINIWKQRRLEIIKKNLNR